MAGFRSVKKYAEAWDAGRSFTGHFRKSYTSSPAAQFVDATLFGGGPPAQYYASTPLESATLSGRSGLYHGEDKSPSAKFLTHFGIVNTSSNNVGRYILHDHVMYYPFVVGDDLDVQEMINSVTLPRYTDGIGLQVMAICQSNSSVTGSFNMTYVNQNDVTRTTPTMPVVGPMGVGNTMTGQSGSSLAYPYIWLADGDTGIKSITSIQMLSAVGGLFALVIVKPLCELTVGDSGVCTEVELVTARSGVPRIYDGAFLSFISGTTGSVGSTAITGYIKTIWDEGT